MKKYIFYFLVFYVLQSFSQNKDFSEFKGKPIKASLVKEISNQSLYMYVDSRYTEAKTDNEIIAIQSILKFQSLQVVPVFRYSFDSGNQNYSICRFKIEEVENEFKIVTQLFLYQKNSWKIVDEPYDPLNDFLKVFSLVNEKFITEFLYDNVESQAIMNEIKSNVSDSYGTVNIKKLSTYIEKNKSELIPYLLKSL